MPKDIASVQRELANLQRQIKQETERAKKELDPKRKADLQKKIIDLNAEREELDKDMEDAVADMHVGSELSFAEGFTKWRNYRKQSMKKLTESEKKKVYAFAKKLVKEKINDFKYSSKNPEHERIGLELKKLIRSVSPKNDTAGAYVVVQIMKHMYPKAF